MEKRFNNGQTRANGRKLTGYVNVFNTETTYAGQRELVRAGAFTQTLLENADILALSDHEPSKVLGRTRSGTLKLHQDEIGLAYELDLPNTRAGKDILELTARGDIGGMSFGFDVVDDNYVDGLREIRAVHLYEISVVSAHAAYGNTSVNLRSDQNQPRLALRKKVLSLWD